MHGRLKVKTTAEQQEAKRIEREKKLVLFTAGLNKAFQKRSSQEFDSEALTLTGDLLASNPDLYTLWNFRKECFISMSDSKTSDEMQSLYEGELPFTELCLQRNHKSYGTWHHRCWVLDHMPHPDWTREVKVCNKYLDLDERNFHGWHYRKFVVERAQVSPSEELAYTDKKIASNFSNYSSWHYRSKLLPIVHPDPHQLGVLEENKLLQEFELVQNAAFTDPNDQSAWFYHRWLLGRGETLLDIVSVHIITSVPVLLLSLSKHVRVGHKCDVVVTIDSQPVTGIWEPVGAKNTLYSTMWTIRPFDLCLDNTVPHVISTKVCGEDRETSVTLSVSAGQEEGFVWGGAFSPTVFRQELSAAAETVLSQELDSCQQLQQLEPDNKWVLLTSVLLMKALGSPTNKGLIAEYLTRLTEIDPYRKNYYSDLGSKFSIEDVLEHWNRDTKELILRGRNLTSLHHLEYMGHIHKVDLSSNKLPSLSGVCYLQNVTEINADDNRITTCEGVANLPTLQKLSLRNNHITCLTFLRDLQTCPQLRALDLRGNPLPDLEQLKPAALELLPQLTRFNGEIL